MLILSLSLTRNMMLSLPSQFILYILSKFELEKTLNLLAHKKEIIFSYVLISQTKERLSLKMLAVSPNSILHRQYNALPFQGETIPPKLHLYHISIKKY